MCKKRRTANDTADKYVCSFKAGLLAVLLNDRESQPHAYSCGVEEKTKRNTDQKRNQSHSNNEVDCSRSAYPDTDERLDLGFAQIFHAPILW